MSSDISSLEEEPARRNEEEETMLEPEYESSSNVWKMVEAVADAVSHASRNLRRS
jgi:hypothetical protein